MYLEVQLPSRSHQGPSSGPAMSPEGAAARQPGPVCNASVSPQHCAAGFQVCRLPPMAASGAQGSEKGVSEAEALAMGGPSQGCISAGQHISRVMY
jgi:hypothetical protein